MGTAEESVKAAVAAYNTHKGKAEPIQVDFQSIGDWEQASRTVAQLNSPAACRFGDIMGLADEQLKSKLYALVEEKAGTFTFTGQRISDQFI